MTVSELIEQLKDKDGEAIVVMSSDAEGNSYSPLRVLDSTFYVADSTYSGAVFEDWVEAKDYVDSKDELQKCVALWPTN